MKNSPPYIISFAPGAAGRFVNYLLHNLLTNSDFELDICPVTNSAHNDNRYTGHSFSVKNYPAIWNLFKFDESSDDNVRIMFCHMFPNFELIKQYIGTDTRVIIITQDVDSILEVIINDRIKNYFEGIVNNTWPKLPNEDSDSQLIEINSRYLKFVGKPFPGSFVLDDIVQIAKGMTLDLLKFMIKRKIQNIPEDRLGSAVYMRLNSKFMFLPENIDYPPGQLLILPYHELYAKDSTDGKYVWLKKLEEFTGKLANETTVLSYQKYIDGRNALIEKYRI